MYSNNEIIEGLMQNDSRIVNEIYRTQYPIIRAWVRKNNGSIIDTDDIFHEAFLIIFRKLKSEKLLLTCSFSTYLFSICKHLWFKELRRRARIQVCEIDDFKELVDLDTYNEIEERKFQIFLKNVNLLGEKCKQLFLLYSNKRSLPEIMKMMGFKNTQAVADKKKNCRKILLRKLINCKEYKELGNEIFVKG